MSGNPGDLSGRVRGILEIVPVIPVLRVARVEDAVPLARALVAGGLPVLEVTLRTGAALEVVEQIAAAVPEAVVGVGTVLAPDDLRHAAAAGACFAVSPGLTPVLAEAARDVPLPLLPGVMTPGEVMAAMDLGFDTLKLFPAEQAGGIAMLNALAGPFPDVLFCPTGGITPENLADYLALPNVACVGGSWIAPESLQRAGDWCAVRERAVAAGLP